MKFLYYSVTELWGRREKAQAGNGDNRLKFLYYSVTELWGRREKAQAGNGKTGTSEVPVHQANPVCKGKA